VLDAYGRQCAVTTEHSLPVLEAAHIRPWAVGGGHVLPNGVPLRRDLHRLFDLGYVTIRPDLTFAVSRRLRDEYANGRVYHQLDGREIRLPAGPAARPDRQLLAWHEAEIFRGR
jgi:putative restriction endonuclease